MTIERGDDMRGKMLIYLALLCLMLAGAGWMAQQAQVIAEERARLQQEILTLEAENALLREKVAELREQQETLGDRMQGWLDEWEVDAFEATAYTLECGYPWDDGITFLETKAVPGYTIAVDPEIVSLGSDAFIVGLGWRKAEDIGSAIRGRVIDLYMGSGLEARAMANNWGRKAVKAVYQK
jgi:3D (Asp-Asp-Asp) domain-containing protein